MVYNLGESLDLARFSKRVKYLLAKGRIVELSEKAYRTGNQNRYLHALLGALALETGNSLDYVKEQYYKRAVNASIFVVEVDDPLVGKTTTLRSSADLSIEEMNTSITRLKKWASEEGFYLPEPGDEELLARIEYEMAKAKQYL